MARKATDQVTTIGIDIGKNNFHLIGLDGAGNIVLRRKLSRSQVIVRLANLPPCLIGMEACVGAHHLSRQLQALGHDARLMPAQYVKPYLRGQKNDFRDAEAIAEAVQRPRMRFVPTKSVEQLDLQAMHRVRGAAWKVSVRRERPVRDEPRQLGCRMLGHCGLKVDCFRPAHGLLDDNLLSIVRRSARLTEIRVERRHSRGGDCREALSR